MEQHLSHRIIGRYIEHIRLTFRKKVDGRGCETEDEKQGERRQKAAAGFAGQPGGGAVAGDENQEDMPSQPVEGQSPIGMHKTGGLCKGHDSPEETEGLKVDCRGRPESFLWKKGKQKAQVHGSAAQLKGKIPPIIAALIYDPVQEQLLVDLADGKEGSACPKNGRGVFGR